MIRSMVPVILALALASPGESVRSAGDTVDTTLSLIDFGADDGSEWLVVNDGVMGGLSRGSFKITDGETGIFSGVLSLENNGGFASVRAAVGLRDLSDFTGLEIRVRGDGRTYQLRLRTDDRFDGIAYRASFETSEGQWTTTRLSFADFRPTFRGRTPAGAPALDPARIRQVGFLLADKQPGEFSLEIDHVRAWAGPGKPPVFR